MNNQELLKLLKIKPKDDTERESLHKPFKKCLDILGLLYYYKNESGNHKRQSDDGSCDFGIIMPEGKTLHIEFKTLEKWKLKDHNLSVKQQAWLYNLDKNNHDWFVLFDWYEALIQVLSRLGLTMDNFLVLIYKYN